MKTLFPGVSDAEAKHFLEAADWDLNTGMNSSRSVCIGDVECLDYLKPTLFVWACVYVAVEFFDLSR